MKDGRIGELVSRAPKGSGLLRSRHAITCLILSDLFGKQQLDLFGAIGGVGGKEFETATDLNSSRVVGRATARPVDAIERRRQFDQSAANSQEFSIHHVRNGLK
jgi:hypothetical protein